MILCSAIPASWWWSEGRLGCGLVAMYMRACVFVCVCVCVRCRNCATLGHSRIVCMCVRVSQCVYVCMCAYVAVCVCVRVCVILYRQQ